MVFTVYVCDDFQLNDSGVLTIFGNYAGFSSNDKKMVDDFIEHSYYGAVVCPATFTDEFGVKPKKVIFK